MSVRVHVCEPVIVHVRVLVPMSMPLHAFVLFQSGHQLLSLLC